MKITTTTQGQIVIPAAIRRKFGIKPGTHILVQTDETNHHIILTPITREYVNRLRGKYKGKRLLEALMEARRQEREPDSISK